jgi:hypothetical protein
MHSVVGQNYIPCADVLKCDERKTNEMHFQSKPYIYNINFAPTCFDAAGAPSSGNLNHPDETVRMQRHKCRISESREWITVCVLSAEGTECEHTDGIHSLPTDNTQTVSTPYRLTTHRRYPLPTD